MEAIQQKTKLDESMKQQINALQSEMKLLKEEVTSTEKEKHYWMNRFVSV